MVAVGGLVREAAGAVEATHQKHLVDVGPGGRGGVVADLSRAVVSDILDRQQLEAGGGAVGEALDNRDDADPVSAPSLRSMRRTSRSEDAPRSPVPKGSCVSRA